MTEPVVFRPSILSFSQPPPPTTPHFTELTCDLTTAFGKGRHRAFVAKYRIIGLSLHYDRLITLVI